MNRPSNLSLSDHSQSPASSLPPWLTHGLYGFVYWACFLLVLEPGNIARAIDGGRPLETGHELLRILVASSLGASVTPLVFDFCRQIVLPQRALLLKTMVMALAALGFGLVLILISCVLANWMFMNRLVPEPGYVLREFIHNWLLVAFALMALSVGCLVILMRPTSLDHNGEISALKTLIVQDGGRARKIDLQSVSHIETQGNYLGFRVSDRTYLYRESLSNFAPKLDPAQFVRVHRRLIVRLACVIEIKRLANGDAEARLDDGTVLRVSRNYSKDLWVRWRDKESDLPL